MSNESPDLIAAPGGKETPATPDTWWQTVDASVDAFVLGWRLTELRSRIEIAADLTEAFHLPTLDPAGRVAGASTDRAQGALSDPVWMASVWRATFKQIAAAHDRQFPGVPTAGTLYEPPGGWENAKLISYLYPAPNGDSLLDYTKVGLGPSDMEATEAFSIHGVTRRALNALVVLYARSDDTLIEDAIRRYQATLLVAMGKELPEASPDAFEMQRRGSVAELSARTRQLLETWDGFLHEQFYAQATQGSDQATKLLAFEAGRALADLTWSVSGATAAKELEPGTTGPELLQGWHDVISASSVIRAQHYVSALGGSFDVAYDAYLRSSNLRPASDSVVDAGSSPSDPDRPSNICQAAKRCLDHWLAALVWLQHDETQPPAAFYGRLRVALVAQSDLWLSLLTGRQNLASFTLESVMNQLLQNVVAEIEGQFDREVGRQVKADVFGALRAVPTLVWIGLGVSGLLIVMSIVWIAVSQPTLTPLNANGLWAVLGIGSLGSALGALFGMRSGSTPAPGGATPTIGQGGANAGNAAMTRVAGLIQTIEASASERFRAAYAQIRRELAAFNHAVGVAYPLIECFVLADEFPAVRTIQTAYTFMTDVVWTREERREEIENVVRAALGPASLLSGVLAKHDRGATGARGGNQAS